MSAWTTTGNTRSLVCRAVAATGVLIALSACGSSGSNGSVEASFVKHADQICQDALKVVAPSPFPWQDFTPSNPARAQLPAVGAYLDGVTFNHKEVALTNLMGKPEHGAALWQQFVDLIAQQQSEVAAQTTAAKASNKVAFVATVTEIQATAKQIDAAAATVGFRSNSYCVQLFG